MKLRQSLLVAMAIVCFLVAGHLGPVPHQSPLFSKPEPGSPRIPGAMRAMNFLATQRAYPGGDLPSAGYTEAFDRGRSLRLQEPADKTNPVAWQPLGPHNIGGRTLAVAFNPQDPSIIYAGSASGGLWRSRTGGVGVSAWEYMPTGHPVLGVR